MQLIPELTYVPKTDAHGAQGKTGSAEWAREALSTFAAEVLGDPGLAPTEICRAEFLSGICAGTFVLATESGPRILNVAVSGNADERYVRVLTPVDLATSV